MYWRRWTSSAIQGITRNTKPTKAIGRLKRVMQLAQAKIEDAAANRFLKQNQYLQTNLRAE